MQELDVDLISDYLYKCKRAYNYDDRRPLFSGRTVSFLLATIGNLMDEVENLQMELKEQK